MRDILTKILVNRYVILIAIIALLLFMIIVNGVNNALFDTAESEKYTVDESNVQIDKVSTYTERGERITVDEALENEDIIRKFVSYCNERKTKEAYSLLSDDCKEVLYPSEEDFINDYFNYYCKEEKEVGIELIKKEDELEVYRIKLYKNSIETGEVDDQPFSDIYSVMKDSSGNKKISINKFIKTERINKAEEYKGIKITLVKRDIYEDEEYDTFEVNNTTDKKISIRTGENLRTIYMQSERGSTYVAPGNEINDLEAIVKAKSKKEIKIRFSRGYNPSNRITAVVFDDIVPDYDVFKENPKNLKTIYTIKIRL